jgi:DNA-dependent RNA polymerase auxiliary subunit epsilon/cytoskeletal protein CcmA (bactofilin family)
MSDTELSGAFSLNTYFTASTPAYFNSTQPFFTDTVYVTGSYPTNNYPPSIADVEVGWLCGKRTMAGQFPQSSQYYTFTGRTSPTAKIYGGLEISENLIVSGTFDIEGRIVVNDDVRINGNLAVSGATSLTGSLSITQTITASNAFITNDLNVGGTLFASKVVTLIESSSIIYSSGSNILGDEVSDTQTLIGSVIMSGSASLSGSMSITNNLSVTNNISSSTISGIGNATLYSTSVDSRLDIVEATASLYIPFSQSVDARLNVVEATASLYVPFSTSVDSRLDIVEATASLYVPFSTSVDSRLDVVEATASLYLPFSTSVDSRLDSLEAFSSSLSFDFVTQAELAAATGSLINQIDTKLNTSSFNAYTQSADIALNALSQSVSSSNGITNARIDGLSAKTGSYATTGSNNFIGNQTITGSLILSSSAAIELGVIGNSVFSGSVSGLVIPLTISSQTASMDCSLGNFFTLQLPSGSATFINPTNIRPGTTLSLRITQAPTGSGGTVGYSTSIKFPQAFPYIVTPTNGAIDILSFQSYDSSSLFGVAVNTMI